ncbi:MAG: hypothetical protein U1F71_02920 [Verrucomicrobiaceae bacterium]
MKWIIRIVIVIAVLAIALLWFGYSNLNKLVKMGIESGTPPVVQTDVTVDSVSLSPFSGTGSVEGFVIGNPKGFTGPRALRIGKADVALDTTRSTTEKIVIKHIRIIDPEINLEAGLGGTNLKHISDNARAFVEKQTGGSSPPPAAEKGKKDKPIKLQIDELLISGAKVTASAAGIVPGAKGSATLPEIRLTGLGSGGAGISPAELISQVLSRLSTEAAKASASGQLKDLLQGSQGKLDGNLKDGVKKLFGR